MKTQPSCIGYPEALSGMTIIRGCPGIGGGGESGGSHSWGEDDALESSVGTTCSDGTGCDSGSILASIPQNREADTILQHPEVDQLGSRSRGNGTRVPRRKQSKRAGEPPKAPTRSRSSDGADSIRGGERRKAFTRSISMRSNGVQRAALQHAEKNSSRNAVRRLRLSRTDSHESMEFFKSYRNSMMESPDRLERGEVADAIALTTTDIEKRVKSLLHNIIKENSAELSVQMLSIPILSVEVLNMIVDNVYEKAIAEPWFGEIYANLCVHLSQSVQTSNFVHIIKSDEVSPARDSQNKCLNDTVYRWSNNVCTTDAEIIGPFSSTKTCMEVATIRDVSQKRERGDMQLEIVSVSIQNGMFIKIMKKKEIKPGATNVFFTVFFPIKDARKHGQQFSELFSTQADCVSDACKKNSFKRLLLNKCLQDFTRQEAFCDDWKKEQAAYEGSKNSLSPTLRAEKVEEFDFRRIRIKKRMLGNLKFLCQFYKVGHLKEQIMRHCIASLMKLKEREGVSSKNPEYEDLGVTDIDEEDHEWICNLFTIIGSTIDKPPAKEFMEVCFTKIHFLRYDRTIPARSRFMYQELLDLRKHGWESQQEIRDGEDWKDAIAKVSNWNDSQHSLGQTVGPPRHPRVVTRKDQIRSSTGISNSSPQPRRQPPRTKSLPVVKREACKSTETHLPPRKDIPTRNSSEMFQRHVRNMRLDYMANGDRDDLLLAVGQVSGTPDTGAQLVQLNCDRMMECDVGEREVIYEIITTLYKNGKLSRDDVCAGTQDTIKFVDSVARESPEVYEYAGILFGRLLLHKAIDTRWLCEQCEKTKVNGDTMVAENLLRIALSTVGSKGGAFSLKEIIDDESAFLNLLGPDTWKAIRTDIL